MHTQTHEYPLPGASTVADGHGLVPRWATAALCAAALASWTALAATAMQADATPTASATHAPGTVTSFDHRPTHDGRYRAEVVEATHVAAGARQSWVVRLTRDDGRRLRHARVTARAWMPETDEASGAPTRVRYVGQGRYRIDGIVMPRAGWWNVALTIQSGEGTDSVAFDVSLPAP